MKHASKVSYVVFMIYKRQQLVWVLLYCSLRKKVVIRHSEPTYYFISENNVIEFLSRNPGGCHYLLVSVRQRLYYDQQFVVTIITLKASGLVESEKKKRIEQTRSTRHASRIVNAVRPPPVANMCVSSAFDLQDCK